MSAATKDLVYLCRALKAPSLLAAADRLLEQAGRDGWSHVELLSACLEREVGRRAISPTCFSVITGFTSRQESL